MPVEHVTGNLLAAPVDALVNTVNCAGVMGKGIALQFKQAWPAMFWDYTEACRAGDVAPGRIHVWETRALLGPRYILNLPTKRHWRDASRLEDVEAGAVALVETLHKLQIPSVAVPPLGCGNGGLDWAVVRPRIVELFALSTARILLYGPTEVRDV